MILTLFSDISWTGLHQRPHHVAQALAKRWTVLWVEPITLGGRVRWSPEQVAPKLYVVSLPEIPYNARQKLVRAFTRLVSSIKLVRMSFTAAQRVLLRRIVRFPGLQDEQRGCVLYTFPLIDAIGALRPSFVQFDYIDNAFGFTSLPAHVKDQWIKTLQTADFVTVSSQSLAKQINPYRKENVYHVGNGVEFQLFSASAHYDRPPDLRQWKSIVGYVGAVYPWIDFQLLHSVCSAMQNVHFVFIGPVHPGVSSSVRMMEDLPNVHFLGMKPYHMVPAYLHYCDVGIIPFQKNELTAYVNPVKMYEYSATGTPTVVTDFSDDVLQVKDHVCVARTAEEFMSCIRKALAMAGDPARSESLKSFARSNDWDAKTAVIIGLIERHMSGAGVL